MPRPAIPLAFAFERSDPPDYGLPARAWEVKVRRSPQNEGNTLMKRIIAALMATAVFAPIGTAQAVTPMPTPHACPTVKQHNHYARQILRYTAAGNDFRASKVTSTKLANLGAMRACAKRNFPARYRAERSFFEKRSTVWKLYRYVDQITIYRGSECRGEYVVPTYIVYRESHCNPGIYNNGCQICGSGAYGWYQLMPAHYTYGYGRRGVCYGMGKSPLEQHICAYRVKTASRGNPWAETS